LEYSKTIKSINSSRKGIILSGGTGTRLSPLTTSVCKQLLPVYDKPLIYYPLSTLMLAGIREILIICTPIDISRFKALLGDGSQWGISIEYCEQNKPEGIAQAFILGEKFIGDSSIALILGDNLFYGHDLSLLLQKADQNKSGAIVFAYRVSDPERYGVVTWHDDENGIKRVVSLDEKPRIPKSNYAITGLYFYDSDVIEYAKNLKPSHRGELEITDVNNLYLKDKKLSVNLMGRGIAWLDTGTFDSLIEAGNFIRTLEKRQGVKISCPEEIAWRNCWIDDNQLLKVAKLQMKSGYGEYLLNLI